MKAFVDPEICIGCELCTQVCPDVFKMENDKAIAYVDPVPKQFEDCANDAAQQCPVTAITVE